MADATQTLTGDGLIIPSNIPGADLVPENVASAAESLRSTATVIRASVESVDTSWSALPVSFVAPDAAVLYSALMPASESARAFSDKLDRIAAALNVYADELAAVKSTLSVIEADAEAFVSDFDEDHRVWVDAYATKKYEWDIVLSFTLDPIGYLHGQGETAQMCNGVAQIKASWLESGWHVDRNNQLLDRVADAYATLNGYEVECANKINRERDDSVPDQVAVEAWQLKQSGDNTADLPWGHRVEEDRDCAESAWHGVGTAALSAVQGLGGLIGYNPMKNTFWDGDHAGQAWVGIGTGIGSLLMSVSPTTYLLAGLGDPVSQGAINNSVEMLKGLVAWDEWSKNPAEAFGATVFNVGTFFIPGAGEVGGVVKALAAGTKLEFIASALTKVDALAANVSKAIPESLGKIFGGADRVGGDTASAGSLNLHIHVPDAAPHVDVPGGSHLPDTAPRVDAPHGDRLESAGLHDPARGESSGSIHRESVDPHPDGGDSGSSAALGSHDTVQPGLPGPDQPHGGGMAEPLDPTSNRDPFGHAGPLPHADGPIYSPSTVGDGWHKTPDANVSPDDYGKPHADYGHVQPWYEKPDAVTDPKVQRLIQHPDAPYGWDEYGVHLDKDGWESRYALPDGADGSPGGVRWPGNDGAVNGTRVLYDNVKALLRDYPEFKELDRLGGDKGQYLAVRGTPFEQRGLTPGHTASEYTEYELSDALPPHVKVEVSVVAPANGFPGGGWQIRFFDGTENKWLRVEDLVDADLGVLK